jgi:hypothetical protein
LCGQIAKFQQFWTERVSAIAREIEVAPFDQRCRQAVRGAARQADCSGQISEGGCTLRDGIDDFESSGQGLRSSQRLLFFRNRRRCGIGLGPRLSALRRLVLLSGAHIRCFDVCVHVASFASAAFLDGEMNTI